MGSGPGDLHRSRLRLRSPPGGSVPVVGGSRFPVVPGRRGRLPLAVSPGRRWADDTAHRSGRMRAAGGADGDLLVPGGVDLGDGIQER